MEQGDNDNEVGDLEFLRDLEGSSDESEEDLEAEFLHEDDSDDSPSQGILLKYSCLGD